MVLKTICPHCQKRFRFYRRNFLVRCDGCGKNFFVLKLHEESVSSRFLSAVPCNYRVSPEMVSRQQYDIPNMSREDASTVLNAARSSCLQRFGKRKQGDDTNNSQSMDSCNSKRQWKHDSLSTNDNASDDKICNDSVAAADSQSAEPHLGEVDVPEEGNATLEGSQQTYNKEVTDSATQSSDNSMIACSCPDIFDFEKFRDANLFAVGQIWALYDELDAMPRFYAQIRHFNASNFEIQLSWLEHNAMNEEEVKWTDNKLPVACGNFFIQKAVDTSQDRFMFSHVVAWTKGKKRNYYRIYPNKGEVWALYKGWSMQWSSEADNRRSYDYEVVEILSTMSHKDGATVIPLVRIKGFVSLFATAKGKCSYEIPSSELLRFSHGIPFYRTNGNEKPGVPGGFLELDTACLPADPDEAFTSVTLVSYMSLGSNIHGMFDDLSTGTTNSKMDSDDEKIVQKENPLESHVCEPISMDSNNDISSEEITCSQRNACGSNEFGDSSQKNCVSFNLLPYAGSVFHDFDEERSFDRFKHGQIWALYSHVDKFPKLYGWVGKVEGESYSIHLNWLEACPQLDQEKQWLDQDLPISYGMFEVGNLRDKFDTYSFSHLVDARQTSILWQVEILPKVGEIWAIYMNWAPDWAPSSSDTCEFAIGEIVERTEAGTKLNLLTQVRGYRSVFRPNEQNAALEIPAAEKLRFSHCIPFFRLTEERGGTLCGFYELDPGSVPDIFLLKKNLTK